MELIGLSGYARSGKDTTADVLAKYGFERVAFADILRKAVYVLNPLMPQGNRVQDVVNEMGWDNAKVNFTEIRTLLQKMGTEVGRNLLGENVWVNSALADLSDDGKYVITDCRFPNEATAVLERGGEVWRVSRQGVGPANQHPSETSLDDFPFDRSLFNNGTLEDFVDAIRHTYEGSENYETNESRI